MQNTTGLHKEKTIRDKQLQAIPCMPATDITQTKNFWLYGIRAAIKYFLGIGRLCAFNINAIYSRYEHTHLSSCRKYMYVKYFEGKAEDGYL